ncbi:MAG: hypothetical protein O6857_06810 [Nitrospinae bacterium]|nr:hypothetical protein [Nitrospinota bacterium]
MSKILQLIKNEQGKTNVVIFLVIMVVLAFLLHPKTSPFADDYYNFKAETQLKKLYSSCSLVWAAGGQHNVSSANKNKKGAATECDLATAVLKPYNFLHDKNVDITIKDGSKSGFSATAKHKEGTEVIAIGADGKKVS